MAIVRRIVVGLFALTLLAAVPSAQARDDTTVDVVEFSESIPFTINAGPDGCAQLTDSVSGTALIVHRVTTTTYPDGSRQIVDAASSAGTVVDEQGRSYRYRYQNQNIVTMAPDGPLAIVEMTDLFTLRGHGQANRIDASFHWLWTYQPTDLDDPFASFVFPPADNWVQFETVGDPLRCDPI